MDTQTSKSELTVSENIWFWMKLCSSKLKSKQLDRVFDLLSLDKYKNTQVNYLSKGEIKKLELFRLVIEQKKLWVMDEPYIGLDQNTTALINDTFIDHTLNEGIIIFASHYEPDIKNMEKISLD